MRIPVKAEYLILFAAVLGYFAIFCTLSILRHRSLNSSYLDLGLEAQTVWNTSQGRFFETSFGNNGEIISALSYHMTPAVLLFSPIYALFPSPITLLVIQTLVLSLGALPIFLISKHVLPGSNLKYAFAVSYLLYPPMEYANIFDFHYVTLATTFLLFAFYFLLKKRWGFFYIFLILSVSTKENLALVSALFGVYLFFIYKERLKGAIISLSSIFYFLAVVYIVFPKLGGGAGALGRYEYLGRNIGEMAFNLVTHPAYMLGVLFMKPKLIYLVHVFASAGFLSLLSPVTLLLAISEFLLNLLSAHNPQWQVKFHYTAAITPFVFISAIYGVARLRNFLSHYKRNITLLYSNVVDIGLALYLISFSLLWNFLHSPSPLYYKFERSNFTPNTETEKAIQSLSKIHTSASVSAMNNLGAHLSNRRYLFRFPMNYLNADYVAVDPYVILKNYDLSQVTPEDWTKLSGNLLKGGKFEMIVSQPRLLLYKKVL